MQTNKSEFRQVIADWQQELHALACEKGWWDEDRNLGDLLMNVHAEISEAWEHCRDGKDIDDIWFTRDGKPDGIAIELADIVIRILDICGGFGVDIEFIIAMKTDYNATRSYRHGGKKA